MSSFLITPLPAGAVDTGAGRPTVSDGRSPCRRCLRDAPAGVPLVLAPYNPFLVSSPYTGDGPVFVHADGCERFESVPGSVSEQVIGRVLAVRAYDADAMMTGAVILAGEELSARVPELLDDARVSFLHVHFAGPGCFAFRVDRA
jgi:hypothetical protein